MAAATAGLMLATPPADARDAGGVFSWSHELNQNEHPRWSHRRPPFAPSRWERIVGGTLRAAGRSGLGFSGASALPFHLPLHPREPTGWRNGRTLGAEWRRTGLRWDVHLEIWAARRALRRGAVKVNPDAPRTAYTRRLSLLDPVYRRTALAEIRRLVPTYRDLPYVHAYTGSDEPIVVLPRGTAWKTRYGKMVRREVRRTQGALPPNPLAPPRDTWSQRRRWLAYTRWSGDRFFAMKAEQARLIRRLDPDAIVNPNDYGFIDGFIPWDYSRLATFADIVDIDPYVSFAERKTPGRGRYNPGFATKLMADLTGVETRTIIQNFRYAGYTPTPDDLWDWSAQALRAGGTHLSFFSSDNPRFTARRRWETMLAIADAVRGAELPDPPVDPAQLVLYVTASEGQGQPALSGNKRYRASGDALYTTYALLGEEAGSAFRFASDEELDRDPVALAGARVVWAPRADVLERGFATRLGAWVRGGGRLILSDPLAFGRTPRGGRLPALRRELIRGVRGRRRAGEELVVAAGALGDGRPDRTLVLPLAEGPRRAFTSVPAGARVIARFRDGAPAVIEHAVGEGRVIAFATDVMRPGVLTREGDWAGFARALVAYVGASVDHPAWEWSLPGAPS